MSIGNGRKINLYWVVPTDSLNLCIGKSMGGLLEGLKNSCKRSVSFHRYTMVLEGFWCYQGM